MTAVDLDSAIPYVLTDAGRAYVRAFVECLQAGYPTHTAIELAERARDRVLLEQEQLQRRP